MACCYKKPFFWLKKFCDALMLSVAHRSHDTKTSHQNKYPHKIMPFFYLPCVIMAPRHPNIKNQPN